MIRGDIYYVQIGNEGVGSEQKGDRYAVIIQNNTGNRYSPTVIVAFISTAIHKAKLPTHVEIDVTNSGIPEPSLIMCEQLRTLDKKRLVRKVGHLSVTKKQELDEALCVSLGMGSIINQNTV
jgi:mRNA interferase MazF